MLDAYQARELDYGITTAIGALIEALGMHWANEQRKAAGESPAYTEAQFNEIINNNGLHSNGVLGRWQGK